MVRYIRLAIPPGMEDVYNPIQDTALMAQISAIRFSDVVRIGNKVIVGYSYEVKNATIGSSFKMWWCQSNEIDNSYFLLERMV